MPLSGLGIALISGRDVQVSENTVTGNHRTGDTAVAGGITLVSAMPSGRRSGEHRREREPRPR